MSDWKQMPLAEAIEIISGGTPKTSVAEYWGGSIPWLSVADFNTGYRWVKTAEKSITEKGLENSATSILKPHDIIISARGTVGALSQVAVPMAFNQSCYGIRAKDGVADTDFIYYALQHAVKEMKQVAHGGVFDTITRDTFKIINILLPPLPEQRAIAHILGTLDDKIELNRRMNETLESMARAIFKSWFMDFDPVCAKAEGRDTGLPKEIADLFPDSFEETELGEVPKGWKVEKIEQYFEAVKGVSYKGSGLCDEGTPLHNLNSVYEGGGYKYEGIKYYNGDFGERHIVKPGDLIVANTEQGHNRLLIGYAAIVPSLFGDKGIASHHIYRLRPRSDSPLKVNYLCKLLNSPQMHDIVSGYANGTTVNMLPIDGVQQPLIVVPPARLVETFHEIATKIENRKEEMITESHTLAELRDTLVPKLISGEIRVADIKEASALLTQSIH